MEIQFEESRATEYMINYMINEKVQKCCIKRNADEWELYFPLYSNVSIAELISACKLVYAKKYVLPEESIAIQVHGKQSFLIKGKNNIVDAITENIFVDIDFGY